MEPNQQLQELFAFADAYQPPEYQLPLKLQPFVPDYVPAIGAPNAFTAPPRPDGEPDFLGLTVLDEPALQQSDPATLALQLRQQLRLQAGPGRQGGGAGGAAGSGGASAYQAPLGWVPDAVHQPHKLGAWIEQVESLHQSSACAAALPVAAPDLDRLMQAWSPEMAAHIQSSPLPDPQQDVDLHTFARMVLAVLDLAPPPGAGSGGAAGLAEALHSLFALYLEFSVNPHFRRLGLFADGGSGTRAAAAGGAAGAGGEDGVLE